MSGATNTEEKEDKYFIPNKLNSNSQVKRHEREDKINAFKNLLRNTIDNIDQNYTIEIIQNPREKKDKQINTEQKENNTAPRMEVIIRTKNQIINNLFEDFYTIKKNKYSRKY